MKFADLLRLPYDRHTDLISVEAILEALPGTPKAVAVQFYADHGRKPDHHEAYAGLALDALSWKLTPVEAGLLIDATTLPAFRSWLDNAGQRADGFATEGWKCIDIRPEVRRQWADHGTWLVPPFALVGSVVGSAARYHVAEGHTRIGLLLGLVRRGVLAPSSKHQIWVGSAA